MTVLPVHRIVSDSQVNYKKFLLFSRCKVFGYGSKSRKFLMGFVAAGVNGNMNPVYQNISAFRSSAKTGCKCLLRMYASRKKFGSCFQDNSLSKSTDLSSCYVWHRVRKRRSKV